MQKRNTTIDQKEHIAQNAICHFEKQIDKKNIRFGGHDAKKLVVEVEKLERKIKMIQKFTQ